MVLGYRMQWREVRSYFSKWDVVSKALPAFTIHREEVSMSSSSLMQGLLIAENAG